MRYPLNLQNTAKSTPCGMVLACSFVDEEEFILNIQGIVGDGWDGMTAQQVVPEIQKVGNKTIRMRINTPGGNVFDALDIHNSLVEHPGEVIADLVGQCCSAGTILASAADKVRIGSATKFMVHRAWMGFLAVGNAEEMEAQIPDIKNTVEFLHKIDLSLAGILSARSGNPVNEVTEMMIGEEGVDGTTFVGKEAVDAGFADELIPNKSKIKNEIQEEVLKQSIRTLKNKYYNLTSHG